MSWMPSYISENGIFTGKVLKGSIQRFLDASLPITGGVQSRFELLEQNTADWYWTGAYGTKGQKIIDLAKNDTANNAILFEIEVKKPENASYWKQTIVFYISYYSDYTQGADYDQWHDHIALGGMSRYEYATPYSQPVVTSIINASPGIDPWYNEGNLSSVPAQWDLQVKRFLLGLGIGVYNNTDYFGVYLYDEQYRITTDNRQRAQYASLAVPLSVLEDLFGGDFEPEIQDDPNEEDDEDEPGPGTGGGGGGYGDHDLPDEGVPVPGLPEYGAAGVNWLTVYKMTQFQINEFGQELIDPDVWTIIKSFFTDPLDAIIGITLIPCDAPSTRTKHPEVGGGVTGHTWTNAYPVLNTEFVEVDCGNLLIRPYWDSAFDFDPFTKFSLFLPFIGFKSIKADDIMGGNIGVKYHVNVMTGDCTAFVTRTASSDSIYGPMLPQVIGEYNGNCAIRVPIGRVSHDAAIDASMRLLTTGLGMVGGAIAGQAIGDPMNVGASQVSNQISGATMTAVNGMKQGIERSGSLGGSAGYMGNLKPFLIRTIPKQYLPNNYKQLNGYPANKGGTLNHFRGTGYQAIETIELNNLTAYDNEIDEIRTLLKGGVLV